MKSFLLALGVSLLASVGFAQSSVSFPRYPALSPDGKTLAFSYQGDLWSAPADGGSPARRLTSHAAYDARPMFSPDGRELAFSSNRFGRNEIFVMPSGGGVARRLTNYAGGSTVQGWAEQGKRVLFLSARELSRRGGTFYTVANSSKPGRAKPLLALDSLVSGQLSPDGTKLAFVRGASDWPRIGYRGAANADIWIFDLTTRQFKQVTDFDGQDLWPQWLPDGKSLVYVSERDGTYNLWKTSIAGGKPTQLTKYVGEGVRFPTVAANGSRAAYEVEDRIDSINLATSTTPRTVALEVTADEKSNPIETLNLTSGLSDLAVSPDGEQVAVVLRGDIFVLPKEGGKAIRVTDFPEREGDITWSPDNKSVIFSRRGQFYAVTSTDTEEPKLSRSLKRNTTALTTSPGTKAGAVFSPDGKQVAFQVGAGELWVANADFTSPKLRVKTLSLGSIGWSPDSKWLTYNAADEEFNSEIFVVPVAGGTPLNVSRHPRNDIAPAFSPDGTKLIWSSERADRQVDLYYVYLRKDDDERSTDAWQRLKEKKRAATGPPAPVVVAIDAENIHERVRRLTSTLVDEGTAVVASGGDGITQIAFVSGADTQLLTLTDGAPVAPPRRIGPAAPGLLWTRNGQSLYLVGPDGSLAVTTPGNPGEPRPVAIRAKQTYDKRELQKAVFEEAWQTMDETYYDPKFHGADWKAIHDRFAPWAAAASDPLDFVDVIRIMMGHLNSSHIGYQAPPAAPGASLPTGFLGTIWDEDFAGPGLKIKRTIKGSPAERAESRLVAGEIVLSINGTTLDADSDPETLLADTVGDRIPLQVQGTDGKIREVILIPGSTAQLAGLLYDEWVASRQKLAHELSGGKLAYLHIQGMNKVSQDKFEAGLYAEGYGRDGLLIDVRDNGGGSTADYLLTMLSIPRHAYTIGRDGAPGYPQDRLPLYPWLKPAALLINEGAYSNAEIFAHAFRALDRGPLIGTPTFGAVISTGARTLLDGSTIRTPGRGWYRVADGVNEEHTAAEPHVRVDITPADELAGRDPQLEAAVKTLLGRAKPVRLPDPKPARLSTAR